MNQLDETFKHRARNRADYVRLARSCAYITIYIVVLFLQKKRAPASPLPAPSFGGALRLTEPDAPAARSPTTTYSVFESLSSVVPPGSLNSEVILPNAAAVYSWLNGAPGPDHARHEPRPRRQRRDRAPAAQGSCSLRGTTRSAATASAAALTSTRRLARRPRRAAALWLARR